MKGLSTMAKGHDRLTPEGKRFFQQLAELKKLQVRIGYQAGETLSDDGVDLASIAAFNELGTAQTPARPFLRNSADNNKNTIEKFCKAQLKKVTQGGTAAQALNAIGSMQKGLVQDTITSSPGWAVPNAPSTVRKKKGADVPLIDEGDLLDKVSYAIKPKGSD
jgi:hypothetical protein